MRAINIHEAKTHLSRLVDQAAQGEPFVIAKAGKPLVKVIALDDVERKTPSRLGFFKHGIRIPDDFDEMDMQQIQALFDDTL